MILKILSKYLMNKYAEIEYQSLFYSLYKWGLKGMNYGGGWQIEEGGESFALDYLKTHFKGIEKICVFDVGANKGTYSQAVLNHFGTDVVIHAFEPSVHTFRIFEDTLAGKEEVSLHQLALGDQEGELTLHYPEEGAGLASVYNRRLDHFGIQNELTEVVKVRTLDDFCEENKISKIDFLKLDVEGHELAVLKGANRLLTEGRINAIQFEFGGCNIDSRTFFQDFYYLLSPHFYLYRIVKNGLVPIEAYTEELEIFKTINYLCLKKEIGI
jgi:FkbM family methyltransferase